MANFWEVGGEDVRTSEIKEMEDSFAPLQKGIYLGLVESAEVKDGDYGKSIKLKLSCKSGQDMKSASVSLKCWDNDDKKRKRAIGLLVKLYEVAGKKLPSGEPDNDSIGVVVGKKMGFDLDTYDMKSEDGKELKGNWLRWVMPVDEAKAKGLAEASDTPKPAAKQAPKPSVDDFEDDIPFN